jgi:hypothetical protein
VIRLPLLASRLSEWSATTIAESSRRRVFDMNRSLCADAEARQIGWTAS